METENFIKKCKEIIIDFYKNDNNLNLIDKDILEIWYCKTLKRRKRSRRYQN